MKRFVACIAGIVIAALGHHAMAQDSVVEGPGVELGEGTVLHPQAHLDTGYISNLFYQEPGDGPRGPVGVGVIRVGVSAALASELNRPVDDVEAPLAETPPEDSEDTRAVIPSTDYRLTGRIDYTQHLSGDFDVKGQNGLTSVAIGLDGHLVLLNDQTLSVLLDDSLTRDTRPRNFESAGNLNRLNNRLKGGLRYRPGQGALQISASYENLLDRFESDQSAFANRMNQLLRGRAEWQFLPITRFFLDTSFGFFGPLDTSDKPSSTPLRILLGGASAITESTTLRAHIGFGKGFYSAGQDFTMALFGAEFGLRYRVDGRFTVAYQYDFQDALSANFYRDHAVLAKVDQQIDQFLLALTGSARLRGYRSVLTSIGGGQRDDVILQAGAKAHYIYREWLAFTAEVDAVTDSTDYMAAGDDPSYNRVEVMLGAQGAL